MRHCLTHIFHCLDTLQNDRQVCHIRISRISIPVEKVCRPSAPSIHSKPPATVAVRTHCAVDRQCDCARTRRPGPVEVLLRLGHVVVEEKLLKGDLPSAAVRVEGLLVGRRGVEVEKPGSVGATEEAELPVWVGELCAAA